MDKRQWTCWLIIKKKKTLFTPREGAQSLTNPNCDCQRADDKRYFRIVVATTPLSRAMEAKVVQAIKDLILNVDCNRRFAEE